jgi:hypothetical protein
MRFSASRLLDIAAVPSIAAPFQGGGIVTGAERTVDKDSLRMAECGAICPVRVRLYPRKRARRLVLMAEKLVADWLKILGDEIRAGDKMLKVVPKMLADPNISLDQVKALFSELEKQAQFVEKLKTVLEGMGHDFPVVDKARALEARYADLAAAAAEKFKEMRK